jgi:phosphoenolpyruvate-protein kinase (PTS system EI component)
VKALKVVGRGQITLRARAEGELRYVKTIKDVIALWKEGASGKIVMVDDAGVTTLGPILSKLAGVVCMSGGLGSHLAIVTREFSIPALMGTKLEAGDQLHGRRVIIEPDSGNDGLLVLGE